MRDVATADAPRVPRRVFHYIDTLARLSHILDVPPADLCAGIAWEPERRRFE